jgi:hypothetical protein
MHITNGAKRMTFLAALLIICVAIGVGSTYFLGNDNFVEEGVEEFVEDETEENLNLPPNSLHIDLSPGTKEG